MNPQVPDELISAYFDGETSPEERAAVERLLANSEDAQRELSETARLSALLHSFPRETAPVELVGNVLRQTEQIPLPVPPPVTVATARPVRSVWRDWTAGFVGAAVSATAMGLVIALNTSPSNEHAERPLAMAGHPEGEAAPFGKDELAKDAPVVAMDDLPRTLEERAKKQLAGTEQVEAEVIHTPAKPGSAGLSQMTAAGFGGVALKSASPPMPSKLAADAAAVAGPAAEPAVPSIPSVTVNELGQTNDEFLKSVSKGEVIALMPQVADPNSNVAVVYFEVVDIDRGAKQIQLLLKKNSITPRSFKNDTEATPNDLVMIYLEADGDNIANTIKDMELHRDLFPKWNPQAPLQFAANSDDATPLARKKEFSGRGLLEAKEKQASAKADGSKPEAENPDVDIVLGALLAERNGYQNTLVSNLGVQDAKGQIGQGVDRAETLQRQQIANSTREPGRNEQYLRNGNTMANGGQLRELARVEPGYDFVRLNTSNALNNSAASYGLNQATPNQAQMNNGRVEQQQQRRYMANSNSDKPASGEANNRALRMLFVLHPQSEGAGVPAAAAPVSDKPE